MARAKHGKELEKEEQKEPQAWEVLTEEEGSPESKLESPQNLQKTGTARTKQRCKHFS